MVAAKGPGASSGRPDRRAPAGFFVQAPWEPGVSAHTTLLPRTASDSKQQFGRRVFDLSRGRSSYNVGRRPFDADSVLVDTPRGSASP